MDSSGPALAAWRERLREESHGDPARTLTTRTGDGLTLEPLYTAADLPAGLSAGLAGAAPWVRGTRASPGSPVVTALLEGVAAAALGPRLASEWTGGASGVRLRLDAAVEAALPAALAAAGGLAVTLECGGDVLPAVAWVLAHGRTEPRASPPRLAIAADPLAALAAEGSLPRPLPEIGRELAVALHRLPGGEAPARPIEISTSIYHEAGAPEALELGLALGSTAEILRRLEANGIGPHIAAPHVGWSLALGRDLFLQIAKLRAARLLWSKLLAACRVDPVPAPRLRAVVSRRTWTRRDPQVNLLRGTTQVLAALVAGADEITPLPHDLLVGEPSELGARLARNTALILGEEGWVGRILDPAGGAYALEALSDALARRAWEELNWVEEQGGVAAALTSGALAGRLASAWEEQRGRFARGEQEITGVTGFRSAEDARRTEGSGDEARSMGPSSTPSRRSSGVALPAAADPEAWVDEAIRALRAGASLTELSTTLPGAGEGPSVTALPRHRDAETLGDEVIRFDGAGQADDESS